MRFIWKKMRSENHVEMADVDKRFGYYTKLKVKIMCYFVLNSIETRLTTSRIEYNFWSHAI